MIKTSYSLGYARATENVTIANCTVSGGYQLGSLLDGSFKPFPAPAGHDAPPRTGRIKIGTETNGDVRNIVVSNCVFDGCHGLAVESEDGAHVDGVVFSNITMRNVVGPPFFLRLGARLRGPAGTVVGSMRNIQFDNIVCMNASSEISSILAGVPGHPIEDVSFTNIRIDHQGGGKSSSEPVSEREAAYPDPDMFGSTPAQAFYLRHAKNITMTAVTISAQQLDRRPILVLDDVQHARLSGMRFPTTQGSGALLSSTNTEDIQIHESPPSTDTSTR